MPTTTLPTLELLPESNGLKTPPDQAVVVIDGVVIDLIDPPTANYLVSEVVDDLLTKSDTTLLDESEQPVPTGETGELCLRARSNPHYPLGYWNRPEDAQEVFGGEWFHTKDVARLDEDGYVWYEGRNDDVIISAGYRIGPFEVESAMVEHPSVVEAAAVGSPDALRGHIVKGFVRLADGVEPSDELAQEIKTLVRGRLSSYAYPREIEFVHDLPKTLTGKIRRIELRQSEVQRKSDVTPA